MTLGKIGMQWPYGYKAESERAVKALNKVKTLLCLILNFLIILITVEIISCYWDCVSFYIPKSNTFI